MHKHSIFFLRPIGPFVQYSLRPTENIFLGLSLNPALRQRMENNVFLSGPDSFNTEKKEKIPVLLLWLCFHQAYSNNIA